MRVKGNKGYTPYSKSLERKGFGKRRGGKIELHPLEVAYLSAKGEAKVILDGKRLGVEEVFEWAKGVMDEFLTYYCVYDDLRMRGYKVRPVEDLLVSKYVFKPLHELKRVRIRDLCGRFENFAIAVVDEESEVTYYRVEEVDIRGSQREEEFSVKGYLVGDTVITWERRVYDRYFYGNLKGDVVFLSVVEAAYMAEKGYLKGVDAESLFEIGDKVYENFRRRYEVYKDLKERGFVVKTGFKFGSDFRVYEEVRSVEDLPHSKYLVTIVDDRRIPMFEIARAVRLAHNVRKKQIFVYSDGGKNRYVLIERIKV